MTKSASQNNTRHSKQILRRQLRSLRRDITDTQRTHFDQAIRHHLLSLVESKAASSLAAYWAFDGEPDVIPLCRQLHDSGTEIALPKIAAVGIRMEFHTWQPGMMLEQNRFGIYEPCHSEKKSLPGIAILLMPLVGYDHLGNRLGAGSGYYDRYLEPMRDSLVPLRVGIAYSLQEAGLISHEDWDVPLHGVVNENGWFPFGR